MSTLARFALPLALVTACAALSASAAERRETRAVSGFTTVALAAPIKLQLTQGDSEGLVLEGEEAALADLESVVEQGVLKIRTRSRFATAGMSKVRGSLNVKAIDALRIAGSGDIDAGQLRAAQLKLAISGSGDIRIGALDASSVDVSVSGSGDVVIGGKADAVSTSIAGSGDVKAGKLEARQAKVSIAGSGDATLWAKDSLDVKIVGSGDVRYYGDPSLKKTIVGSGSVRRVGATPS
jgi:hypothetical protein